MALFFVFVFEFELDSSENVRRLFLKAAFYFTFLRFP